VEIAKKNVLLDYPFLHAEEPLQNHKLMLALDINSIALELRKDSLYFVEDLTANMTIITKDLLLASRMLILTMESVQKISLVPIQLALKTLIVDLEESVL